MTKIVSCILQCVKTDYLRLKVPEVAIPIRHKRKAAVLVEVVRNRRLKK